MDTPYKFKAPVIILNLHFYSTAYCPHAQVGAGVTKSISIEEEINKFLGLSSECKIVWDVVTPPTFMVQYADTFPDLTLLSESVT